jgi:hypothetical protein
LKYRLYSSEGNTLALESYLGYFEIGDDGYVVRYLETRADGTSLRYSTEFDADEYGCLPEGPVDEAEASQPHYGLFSVIAASVFESVWTNTQCRNRAP